ncbi:restriction endonuclease subunit S [Streptococcus suis]|uniref:restriction endonuclease subunit S n=1 Tax=Streptococcus suis TaxID=1307 RepID=UPI001C9701CC|nr:restriction endonuclease subunit S [Streptococcus suis]MBY4981885.1 restriction endonuclease subunit S [Streptococcus suis]MBY4992631.1 restriction endonuclease subunit S [Streptococcus suis]MBY5008038.1 restriction endonuclease subunit S [Streptococcus suis]
MTKEKSTVPRLRFPGFTDAWKQRKLGEVSKRVTRRNKELISSLPLTISAQHGLVDQEEFFNKQVASKDVSSYYLIKKGEFAYNKSYSNGYPWGAIKRLDRYEMGVLSTLYIVFKPTSLICSDYLVSYYDTVNWYKEVSMIAAEGARNHGLLNIAPNDFFKTRLFIPTLPEQEAIGSFFSDLDQLITLHQRKLDDVKELKKALLQKMFPKGNGNDFPELRFPEFTDAWKQRKLGEVAEKISQKNLDRQYVETFTNSAEFGIISQRDFFEKNISSLDNISGYYIVSPDDFVYNPRISNLAPVGPIKRNKLGRVGVMSPLYTIFRFSDIHLDFVEKYFDTTIWHRYMELNGNSGARSDRFAIKDSVFKGLPIPLPTHPEQEAIGSFFSDLDQLITLHQRQLDHLKLLKKALLQQMFI